MIPTIVATVGSGTFAGISYNAAVLGTPPRC